VRLIVLGLAGIVGYWLIMRLLHSFLRFRGGQVAGQVVSGLALSVFIAEFGAGIVLSKALDEADSAQAGYFKKVFAKNAPKKGAKAEDDADGLEQTGLASAFKPHHYMNYSLNPDFAYKGRRQFNREFLIRRSEPIREREEVKWRALVLGGSTTFGEGILNEEDTWVYQLEKLVRKKLGEKADVINGGVGGYNVVDNTIHYLLFLEKLDPDVVILFEGINDVHPRLFGTMRPDYSNARRTWTGKAFEQTLPDRDWAWSNVYRLYYFSSVRGGDVGHIYSVIQYPYQSIDTWRAALKRNDESEYRRHLGNLVEILRSQGRKVVIVPQIWIPRPGNEKDAIFSIGVSQHNRVNEAVASENRTVYARNILDKSVFFGQSRVRCLPF